MREVTIESKSHLFRCVQDLTGDIHAAKKAVTEALQGRDSLDWVARFKFEALVKDPHASSAQTTTNLFEFSNQIWTTIASYRAVDYLLSDKATAKHRYHLNLGTKGGFDIYSDDKQVIAEVFATTNYAHNQKLKNEYIKLQEFNGGSRQRYIFALLPDEQVHKALAYKPRDVKNDAVAVTVVAFGVRDTVQWLQACTKAK